MPWPLSNPENPKGRARMGCGLLGLDEPGGYSIFDSALYGNQETEWLFPQEKATLHDFVTSICESKML
jgi:hypothetical protein